MTTAIHGDLNCFVAMSTDDLKLPKYLGTYVQLARKGGDVLATRHGQLLCEHSSAALASSRTAHVIDDILDIDLLYVLFPNT